MFPDEFPFKRPGAPRSIKAVPAAPVIAEPEPQVAESVPTPTPVVQAAPAPLLPRIVEEEEQLPQPPPASAEPVDHERRRSPRQGLIAKALVRNENGNGPGWKVDLLNISMLGIRFRSHTSLLPGDTASVKLEVGPVKWATKLRVIHSHRLNDGNYSIGCQFVANELARGVRRAA